MNRNSLIYTASISLLFFGASVFIFAQHDQQNEKQHTQQQNQPQQHTQQQDRVRQPHTLPQQTQQHPVQQDRVRQPHTLPQRTQQHPVQQDRVRQPHTLPQQTQQHPVQRDRGRELHTQQPHPQQHNEMRPVRQPLGVHRDIWQQHRARTWESEHRTWSQRGGYNGYRVPEPYFRSHYGRRHWFRIYRQPFYVVGGYPRFRYGNYWFSFLDPYPEFWGPAWYETDDVYIEYFGDGYYLYNRRYPGRPGIAISISF